LTPQGGIAWKEDGSDLAEVGTATPAYAISKAANYLLAVQFGKRTTNASEGVLHLVSFA
jgi:hypothetical protein